MKPTKIFACLFLLATAALPALAGDAPAQAPAETPAGPQPKLTIPSLEHDFGVLKAGTPMEFRFEFKNEGAVDLLIQKVKAACGCTTSAYDSVIAPGKTGGVSLVVKKTDAYKGSVIKTATVTTNDPTQPTLKLSLKATSRRRKRPRRMERTRAGRAPRPAGADQDSAVIR